MSPLFKPAVDVTSFVKAFFFGKSGSGKTFSSLACFPKPAIIDSERGSIHYAKIMKEEYNNPFVSLHMKEFKALNDLIVAIRRDPAKAFDGLPFIPQTLIIDSITPFYADLVTKSKLKFPDNRFNFERWDWIHSHWAKLLQHIIDCDMNIVCTARDKDTKNKEGEVVGHTFEAGKSSDYVFDSVFRFFPGTSKTPDGKPVKVNMFEVVKDRTRRFNQFARYVITPEIFTENFGPVTSTDPKQNMISSADIEKIQSMLEVLGVDKAKTKVQLEKSYGVGSIQDLSAENAKKMVARLNAAQEAKKVDAADKKTEGKKEE